MSTGPPPPPSPQPPQYSQYPPEKSTYDPSTYDPSNYSPMIPPGFGQGQGGYLALIDEETGEEVGVVDRLNVSGAIEPGSQEPVQIELPPEGSDGVVTVRPSDEEYLRDAQHPAFANSHLVQTAVIATRFIVTAASYAAKAMESGANTFTQKVKPVAQPITFTPATHSRVRKVHNFTSGAAKVSSNTLGKVQHHAQNFGAKIAGKNQERGPRSANAGIISKGLIAVGTIADGIDHAGKMLLSSSSNAATSMVGHRYGDEAREVARGITGSAKNVGLVYVDAAGVTRRAIVKSVAKGMVVGRVRGGGEVIVQSDQIDPAGPTGSGSAQFHTPPMQHAKTWNSQEPAPLYSPQPRPLPQYANLTTPSTSGYPSGRSSPAQMLYPQVTGSTLSGYVTPPPPPPPPPPPQPQPQPQQQQQQHYPAYPPPAPPPQGTPYLQQSFPPPPRSPQGTPQPQSFPPPPAQTPQPPMSRYY